MRIKLRYPASPENARDHAQIAVLLAREEYESELDFSPGSLELVDAHIDDVRWSHIVSRIFGRIDPLSDGGRNYRQASPNVTVYDSHTRFAGRADGRYRLRTDNGEEFTADQVVIAAGSRAMVPEAIAGCGVDFHTSDTIMRLPELPGHLVIVGGGFVAAEFAHVFSALGSRITVVLRGGTMLSHCDDTICERFTDIAGKPGRPAT